MDKGICSVAGCLKNVRTRGLCKSHYEYWTIHKRVPEKAQEQHHGLHPQDRFMKRVLVDQITGCWNWQASMNNGYGQFRLAGQPMLAHRAAWTMFKGNIPSDGSAYGTLFVCHRCDNPACVNPEHLFLGTHQDNNKDMMQKGRLKPGLVFGSAHGNAKVNAEMVVEIRASDLPQKKIAEKYGIKQSTVNDIRTRKSWKHVP